MTSHVRFQYWTAVILLLAIGQPLAMILAAISHATYAQWLAGILIFELPILALIALLATTPFDAIRLKPAHSQWIIVAGTALLHGLSLAMLSPRQPAIAIVAIGAASLAATGLRAVGKSPWWIVPIVWNPALLAIPLLL